MTEFSSDTVVPFGRNFLDPKTPLTRIGLGEIGGKAHGLAHIRGKLFHELKDDRFPEIKVDIPPLAVICTGLFDAFMQENDLYGVALSNESDDRIAKAFQQAEMPFEVLGDLRALINQAHSPLAIRSSSLLEDARHEPFAGVYVTKMVPNNSYDPDLRFRQLIEAIKYVYASTFFRNAKDYRLATRHGDEEERMAVIIHELAGKRYPDRFYPELSGVARSINHYPMNPAKPEDGVVNLALGLGKTIVDGCRCWSYSPAYPRVQPPFGSVEQLLKETQKDFWVVNMGEPNKYNPIRETEYLSLENLMAAERDGSLRYLASTYSPVSGRLSIGTGFDGPRALTFAPLLLLDQIPFNNLIKEVLLICEQDLGGPVEIEFAMSFNPNRFAFLQVRSMEALGADISVSAEELQGDGVLVACEHSLGNGVDHSIADVVYTIPEAFDLKHTLKIMPELEDMNRALADEGRPYLLIVLGRLGTTDHWLGIPINWGKIAMARAVVEATSEKARVELSQGSHYFHNIISMGVKYFNLSLQSPYKVDWAWLDTQKVVRETNFLRHVRLDSNLSICVDGKTSRGVILKPQEAGND
jgi:hypothetical protein